MARHKGQARARVEVDPTDLPRLADAHARLVAKLATLKPAAFERYTMLLAVVVMLAECGRAWGADVEAWPADRPGPDANEERRAGLTLEDIAYLRDVDHLILGLMSRYDSRAHHLYVPLFASRILLQRCAALWSGRDDIWDTANNALQGRPPVNLPSTAAGRTVPPLER